jgi:signal peptidase I
VATEPSNLEKRSWRRLIMGRSLRFTLVRALMLVLVAFIIFRFVLIPVRVTGQSMEPTCHNGELGLLNMLAYKWHPPRRGDLVGFIDETDGALIIKRIIALPNEQVVFERGKLFINGLNLDEPYLHHQPYWNVELYKTNAFFVLGDNRSVTRWFFIQDSQMLGRFIIRQN